MKKIFLLIGIAFAATMISCGPTTEDAIKHNDNIVADQKEMLDLESDFVNAIVDGQDEAAIKKSYKKYTDYLGEMEKKYDEMDEFDEKDTFRKAMIGLVKEFKKVAENEYDEMVKIYTKDADALTDADFEKWEELTNVVDEKESKANDDFLDAQKEFAKEYNFELKD
ncbi:MAG TPA: hypothetical protein PLA88_01575 [Bacteroidales bacterium]|jgi:alpha-glucuronidase|nr:hypothetical protein [Bacteroidales bacterium]